MKTALRSLFAGCVVYLAMAACSAVGNHGVATSDGGTPGASGSSGSSAGGIGGALSDVVDDVLDPVGEASAAGAPPDIAQESCTKVITFAGTVSEYAAEHAYPGKTKTDLSGVRALIPNVNVPGYDTVVGDVYVTDGSAIALCGPVSAGAISGTVQFILPGN